MSGAGSPWTIFTGLIVFLPATAAVVDLILGEVVELFDQNIGDVIAPEAFVHVLLDVAAEARNIEVGCSGRCRSPYCPTSNE